MSMSISIINLMSAYNISFEEAQTLQFNIILIMLLILGILYGISFFLKKNCPKIYDKLEELGIL